MSNLVRFGVSLDAGLLEKFDALCREQGYDNRSEAIRDLIRQRLVEQEWEDADQSIAATMTLVYDHHKSDLAQRITHAQHDAHELIVTTLHVHLDHCHCLEVLVLKGKCSEVKKFAENLVAIKGVMFGTFSLATMGEHLA